METENSGGCLGFSQELGWELPQMGTEDFLKYQRSSKTE